MWRQNRLSSITLCKSHPAAIVSYMDFSDQTQTILRNIRLRHRLKPGVACWRVAGSLIFVGGFALAGSVLADERLQPRAADIDWRSRHQLSSEQQAVLPAYCEGSYVKQPTVSRNDVNNAGNLPIHAWAQKVYYEHEKSARLEGQVELTQGPFRVEGESAVLDQQANMSRLTGGIRFRGPGLLLTGNDIEYSLATGEFELNMASYLIHSWEIRGDAKRIERPAPDILIIEEGSYTTCAPNDDAWSLKAERIELDRAEGVGEAKHVTFRVKDVPVLYFPWFSFPIDDRRKSGFLYPQIGTSNVDNGLYLSTPYYLNLAPNYDMTLSPQYVGGRGLFNEVQGRYLNAYGQTDLEVGYIADDEAYAEEYPSGDSERWALNLQNESYWSRGWQASIDYNVVSDNDYLSDLNRTLRIDNETHLDREARVYYANAHWQFTGLLHGFQTVDGDVAEADEPYSRLPELWLKGQSEWRYLSFEWQSEYIYFWRDNENLSGSDRVNGSRLRHQPKVALPLEATWGYLTPSIKLDHTDYWLDDQGDDDSHIGRTVPFYALDTGLYFDKYLTIRDRAFKHSIEPRLFYVYSPATEQGDIPDFDTSLKSFNYSLLFSDNRFIGGDRVADNNRLSLGITTRFTEEKTGIDRAIISLGQVYYFEDREVDLNGEGGSSKSDSPWAGELTYRPSERIDLSVSGLWDESSHQTAEGATRFRLHSKDYDYILNLGHRFKRGADALEQTDVSTVFPLSEQVSVFGRWLYDLQDDRTIGTLSGLEYRSCCWRVQLLAESHLNNDDEIDHSILLRFELRGLGTVGESARELDNAIPGYFNREQVWSGHQN